MYLNFERMSDMKEAIPLIVILSFVGMVFISMGIYALRKKTPIHFWSGTTVKSEEIKDIQSYNRANGIMWILYGISFILSGLLGLFVNVKIAGFAVIITCFFGLIIVIIAYHRIYNKYKA